MPRVAAPARDRARTLRADSTDAERRLWSLLRGRRLGGWKFRRQHPIPPWTADYACPDARLVVEADGGQHAGGVDNARDADLAARGWRVLRFWNDQILRKPEAVAEAILRALEEGPSPPPSPSGEGEGARTRASRIRPLSLRQEGEGGGEGKLDGRTSPTLAILVHDLAQARAALAAVPHALLLSAGHLAPFAGPGFLYALERQAGAPLVVDCADDAGLAMAALRAGSRDLLFTGDAHLLAPLAEMAEALGGRVRDRLDLPVLRLDPGEDPARRLASLGTPDDLV